MTTNYCFYVCGFLILLILILNKDVDKYTAYQTKDKDMLTEFKGPYVIIGDVISISRYFC